MDAAVEALAFFKQIQDRKDGEAVTLNKATSYRFILGSCRTVPGYRLDIEEKDTGHTVDYIGLGTDGKYVSAFVKKMLELFEQHGFKVVD